MFDNLSNKAISAELDGLMACLGVKEDGPLQHFLGPLRKKDVQGCVQAIAGQLGLPVRVSLSYVPKDFKAASAASFRSSALANTDWAGRGIESITAQVEMPDNLPMFGTRDLEGYPIRVRVSENCCEDPETFVGVMAHELSHVLLRSILYAQHDSELHADLVPILLGFRGVVQMGRTTVRWTTGDDLTRTHTTTYGYLTDSQFAFAYKKVKSILQQHQLDKNRVLELIEHVQHKLKEATQSLETFGDYLKYLDTHPPQRMKPADAQRVVQFHVWGYSKGWEIRIAEVKTTLAEADAFIKTLRHYTASSDDEVKERARGLELASEKLGEVTKAVTEDVKASRRYVSVFYRIRRFMRRRA